MVNKNRILTTSMAANYSQQIFQIRFLSITYDQAAQPLEPRSSPFLPNSSLCVALTKTIFSLSGQILTSSKVIPQRRHQLTRTSSDSVTAARVHIFNTHLSYCLSFISTQPSFRPTNPRITIIEILIYKLQIIIINQQLH